MVVALRVADVANRGVACATIEVDESTSLAELRALYILSLPTAQKALKDGLRALRRRRVRAHRPRDREANRKAAAHKVGARRAECHPVNKAK